ncbi:uncharacterized protein TNCV_3264741 [Trichonephila clavipes]|nr:uncharacterized protein TNCV_3264741 [Trichonephila clavipes]
MWLWNPKRRKGLSPKLQTNWEGPYTVLKGLNDVVVRIQKSPHSKPKRRDQEPTDFIYDLLKLHKQLGLGMSEEALVGHIFVRLEPQNPQNTVQLLEVSKFEERYSCKTMWGS